jgi:peptide/nickel transport system substrate-binding protein
MEQFHPDYAGQAAVDKLTADAGFDKWTQLFEDRHDRRTTMSGAPGPPSLFPWQPRTRGGEQQMILERNPYYYGVDPEGNQLPYIDKIVAELVEDIDVLTLRTIAGEFDHQPRQLRMDSVPTLQKNTESGDYRVLYWPGASGSDAGLHFNQNYGQDEAGDPAIGELMRNNDFRIGLSHAVDRDKILQLVFLGAGESRQMVVPSNNPYYPGDEYAFKYTEYDTAKANEILDGILPNKDADGFRLLDSGDVAEIEVTAVELFGTFWPQTGELVKEMWEDVGVKTKFTQNERSAYVARRGANELQVMIWDAGGAEHLFTGRYRTMPFNSGTLIGPLTGTWYATGGEKGIEPWGDLAKVIELHDKGDSATFDEKVALGQEIFRINVDNLWTIGTVGNTPTIFGLVVTKNNFRNVPDGMSHQWWYTFRPEQRFFKQ